MSQPVSGYLYARNLLLLDARRTVSGSATGSSVDVSSSMGNGVTLAFYCDTVTASGNVTATVQQSDASGSGQASVTNATLTISATGLALLFVPNVSKKFINISWALNSGTSIAVSTFLYLQPDMATTSSGFTIAPQV